MVIVDRIWNTARCDGYDSSSTDSATITISPYYNDTLLLLVRSIMHDNERLSSRIGWHEQPRAHVSMRRVVHTDIRIRNMLFNRRLNKQRALQASDSKG